MKHYHLHRSVPQSFRLASVRSIPFFFCPSSEEWRMSLKKYFCLNLNIQRISSTHSFVSIFRAIDFAVHRHEDDSIFELIWLDPVLCHRLLNLMKQLQCCVSNEICPLELEWFQFTIFTRFQEPRNLCSAIQPMGRKSQRVVDRRSGHLHVKGRVRKSDLECEWNVQKRSSKGTTTTAHVTWRAFCEDDYFVRHKHKLEPWLSLEPREKN